MTEKVHRETLEEQTTHMGGEARMMLPGVQMILGFQLMAVFNRRFEQFSQGEQIGHFWAFLLTACTMALLMAPAAYHRQVERDRVTTRFVTLSSWLLAPSMSDLQLDARAAHLAVDMQRLFAEPGPWHVPWLGRILPNVAALAERHPERTVFTRLSRPGRPG